VTKQKTVLIGLAVLILLASVGVVGAENIEMPVSGENKSLWDLTTDPWTRYMGNLFYGVVVALAAGLVWIKAGSGPALSFFLVANAVLAGIMPGQAGSLFALFAALAFVAIVMKTLVTSRG